MTGWKRYSRRPHGFSPDRQLTRDPSQGMISGVCAGVARYLRMSRPGLRALYCIGAVVTGIMPFLILYVVLTFVLPVQDSADTAWNEAGPNSEKRAKVNRESLRARRAKLLKSLSETEKRLNRLESYLISSEYEWERKYRGL